MSFIADLKKLDDSYWAAYIGAFISVVAPGFLTFQLFRPDLVEKYDVAKLFVLSGSVTAPVFLLNFIWALFLLDAKGDAYYICVLIAEFLTFIVLYFALLVSYFGSLPFPSFLGLIVALDLLPLLQIVRDRKWAE